MGPLPTSSQGNKYILVVTDLFTKWVEAFPLKDTTATTLATTMLNEVICRYSVPSGLQPTYVAVWFIPSVNYWKLL